MKKRLISLLLASAMCISLVACNNNAEPAAEPAATEAEEPAAEAEEPAAEEEAAAPSELVDGKFAETRQITVEVYDRGNDGGSDPTDNKIGRAHV